MYWILRFGNFFINENKNNKFIILQGHVTSGIITTQKKLGSFFKKKEIEVYISENSTPYQSPRVKD